MSKGLPEHRQIVVVWSNPNYMLDADPFRITAPEPVRDVQRAALAFARAAQKPLIPAAGGQLIPNEGGNAARAANRQPRWPIATRKALPTSWPCKQLVTLA
jgi:hypothetical protein